LANAVAGAICFFVFWNAAITSCVSWTIILNGLAITSANGQWLAIPQGWEVDELADDENEARDAALDKLEHTDIAKLEDEVETNGADGDTEQYESEHRDIANSGDEAGADGTDED
jgi:hypothetical protein